MANYSLQASRTAGAAKTVGSVAATATPRRIKIYECTFGCSGAPADNIFQWEIQRFTAPGTSTAVTPQPLDPADAAALTAGGSNHTVEPTYTAGQFLLTVDLNQRATFRWVAPPGGELVTPATNNNGAGVLNSVATGLVVDLDLKFQEQ